MPVFKQRSPLKKSPRIGLLGIPLVRGALVKKPKTKFKVVGLKEVFKTAVEVNGTLIREHCTNPRRWKPRVQPYGEFLEKSGAYKTAERRATLSPRTVILCIDDNTTSLNIRQMLLEAKGFVVRTANNGLSGLEITDKDPVDAVILDYAMPGMDGEEVAKRLRARHPHIPILLLSGFHGSIPESLLSMVDGFLQKGSPAALLIAEVERLTRASGNPVTEERKRA